ncbi:hypothetical protein FGSG_13644 [Fusarium graminearum PH-1]|uniref:Chromosome 4, complete genome n=1 Tax=Gibberella zeae (strain ATCC MYA-4620 / CBS 123657 / FGSC 9075 / NRRL 31084 / PH-1) TaxID=229533 RepID=I1S9W3_GIBZE|nr:hypothetical protein FGSG_13644 [Fusarium graminearum PH-1]ESU16402.1 hypothetical protein FGSG_13644 [Fusarium graminearum PH-1]CEF85231.1 unnamed protein product [Fusarium graminearum]|eukprot:XP_011327914.1 hypothetical protein FGSG_13644 [Fusarium graminearum PH-1]
MHAVGTQARGYGEKLPAEQCTISSLARYSVSTIGRVDAASRCPCRNETASHRIASHRIDEASSLQTYQRILLNSTILLCTEYILFGYIYGKTRPIVNQPELELR